MISRWRSALAVVTFACAGITANTARAFGQG